MLPQAAGDLLHRLDLAPHRAGTPLVQELHGPARAGVLPESLKVFSQEMAAHALQIVFEQLRELHCLLIREILASLEQTPARVLQHRLIAILLQAGRLGPSHFVQRLIHLLHDVKAVQDVHDLRQLLGNDVQVRLPHVATDKTDGLTRLVVESLEESSQAVLRALSGDPQQSFHPLLDLVDQRQVVMSPLPLDLIHANRLERTEILVEDAPENRVFDRLKDVPPRGAEDCGHFLPGQIFGPTGQEPTIARRQMALSHRPRHTLDRHAAGGAVHPPQGIHEVHGHSPEGHKLKPPLRKPIITGSPTTAARANRPSIPARMQLNLERRLLLACHPVNFSVHKGLERFNAIEDSLQLHPVVAPGETVFCGNPSLTGNAAGCTYWSLHSLRKTDPLQLVRSLTANFPKEQQRRGKGVGVWGRNLGPLVPPPESTL